MRVLVAGASGAVGRYLLPQLLDAKHEVIGVTRTAGALSKYVGVREIVADVLDRDAFFEALDGVEADAVIHQLTSLAKSPATFRDMRMTNRLRTEGTSSLIAAARRIGATRFVAASFFGGYGLVDLGGETVDEDAPFGEPDGRSDAVLGALLSLEQQVHAFGGVTLRYGLFYDSTTTGTGPVSRTWNGVLPMLHLSDAANAAVLALTEGTPGSAYNIADSSPMSYRAREFARAAAAGLHPPAQYSDGLLRLVAPFGSLMLTRQSIRLSSEKAADELGWTPQYPSLADGLTRVPKASAAPKPVVIPLAVTPVLEVADPPEEETPLRESEVAAAPEPEDTAVLEPEDTAVLEPVEGPPEEDPSAEGPEETTEPEPEPTPLPEETTPAPEAVEGSPVDAPADEETDVSIDAAEQTDETDEREGAEDDPDSDPFADIDAAIARIGTRHKG